MERSEILFDPVKFPTCCTVYIHFGLLKNLKEQGTQMANIPTLTDKPWTYTDNSQMFQYGAKNKKQKLEPGQKIEAVIQETFTTCNSQHMFLVNKSR